jgi:hypothetical protein
VSRGGSYFGSDKDPSRTFSESIFVILVRLSGLSLIIPYNYNVSSISTVNSEISFTPKHSMINIPHNCADTLVL